MGFLDLILGKKIIRNDDFFGKIRSDRTRKKDINKPLNWQFNMKIGQFKYETFIILDGNYRGINPKQKIELKHFIENFDSFYAFEVDKLIENNKLVEFKNWRNKYYISFINPLFDSNSNFEIDFDSIDEQDYDGYFSVELINRVLKNIE